MRQYSTGKLKITDLLRDSGLFMVVVIACCNLTPPQHCLHVARRQITCIPHFPMEKTGLFFLLYLSLSAPQAPAASALRLNGSACPLKLRMVAFNLFLTSRLPSDTK